MHSHPGFDETFYVVAGEWEFVAGERTIVVEPGTLVHLPRGIFHAFRSTGRLDGKLVGIALPGGIEEFFEEAANGRRRAGGADAWDRVRCDDHRPERSLPRGSRERAS